MGYLMLHVVGFNVFCSHCKSLLFQKTFVDVQKWGSRKRQCLIFLSSQMVLISLASTIRTCSRKKLNLLALMCPRPCPLRRERRPDHLLLLLVSPPVQLSVYHMCFQSFNFFFLLQVRGRLSLEQNLTMPSSDEVPSPLSPWETSPPPPPCLPRTLTLTLSPLPPLPATTYGKLTDLPALTKWAPPSHPLPHLHSTLSSQHSNNIS